MARLAPLNLKAWIEEHRHLLKPPVGNAMVWKDSDFQVMVIGGPNQRNDYHVDPSEELFFQIEGDIVLRVMEGGQRHDIPIREGEMLLLPALVPHCPVRGPGTIGLVVERQRRPGETEALRWYCDGCGAILHEATMQVTDLGLQLTPVIERFYADESLRTCRTCGTVTAPPAPAR
jgi:3-hydroxyanthranilate 3,4-dioxygenase